MHQENRLFQRVAEMEWLEITRTHCLCVLSLEREKDIFDNLSFCNICCGVTFGVVALLGSFLDQ